MVRHVNVLMTARDPVVPVWLEVSARVVTTASVVMHVPVVKALVTAHKLHNIMVTLTIVHNVCIILCMADDIAAIYCMYA